MNLIQKKWLKLHVAGGGMTAQPTVVDQYFLVKIHGICPKLSKFDENWSNFIKLGQKLSIFIKKEKKFF